MELPQEPEELEANVRDDGQTIVVTVIEQQRLAAIGKIADALIANCESIRMLATALAQPVKVTLDGCRIHKIGEGPAILVGVTPTVDLVDSFISVEEEEDEDEEDASPPAPTE